MSEWDDFRDMGVSTPTVTACTCRVLTGGAVAPSDSCPIHIQSSLFYDGQYVPLSAIRALVQQWREKAEAAYIGGRHQADMTFRDCADQLAALCPAPLEDRK